jgi:hypothetical protein
VGVCTQANGTNGVGLRVCALRKILFATFIVTTRELVMSFFRSWSPALRGGGAVTRVVIVSGGWSSVVTTQVMRGTSGCLDAEEMRGLIVRSRASIIGTLEVRMEW